MKKFTNYYSHFKVKPFKEPEKSIEEKYNENKEIIINIELNDKLKNLNDEIDTDDPNTPMISSSENEFLNCGSWKKPYRESKN